MKQTERKNSNWSVLSRVGERGTSKLALLLSAVVVLLVIAGAVSWAVVGRKSDQSDKALNSKEFQALFLTNGQVYFGKLSNLGQKYVTLTDIYYLQVQQASGTEQSVQPAGSTTNNSQISLAKLGNELHGPEDKMEVSSQQVLFWENLKSNSKVVQAIDKYQNQ